jgi:hypothetical protein
MIHCGMMLVSSGGCAIIPANANVGATGAPGSCSFSANTDGTIVLTGNNSDANKIWYTPTGGTPGNAYFISYHLVGGTTWTAGLVDGTVYALSSNRSIAWSTSGSLSYSVTASFWLDSGGTQLVGTTTIVGGIN